MKFLLKIARNGLILAGMMFVSIWATGGLSWIIVKPVVIFFVTYILTELARYFKLAPVMMSGKIKATKQISPMIF